ncbi:MAG: bacteriohemerythrin [Leptospiraceae bacterium]|nr:bacteriohemerythrin [Leptospiraceae bacterium]
MKNYKNIHQMTNHLLSKFIPQEFLTYLQKDNILQIRIGDQISKDMTILFSDIRSFTALTEKTSSEGIFAFLNQYFGKMNELIQNHNGLIDKYIGDAILAIFPDSSEDAITCAIEMQKYVKETTFQIGEKWKKISMGIGIHSGNVLLGVVGGNQLMQTTVISDVVNTASRLESLTKEYGAPIIISEDVFKYTNEEKNHELRFLDCASIRGKEKLTFICEVYDFEDKEQIKLKNFTKDSFDLGLMTYQSGEYQRAWEIFLDILTINPKDQAAAYYLNKTASFLVEGIEKHYPKLREDYVKWNESWSTKIDLIDNQHKILFTIINDLERAIHFNKGMEILKRIFYNLKIYTFTHFSLEEALMYRAHFPDLDHHKEEHKKFIAEVEKGEHSLQKDSLDVSLEILHFLCKWLTNHIQKSDRDGYAPYLISTDQVVSTV